MAMPENPSSQSPICDRMPCLKSILAGLDGPKVSFNELVERDDVRQLNYVNDRGLRIAQCACQGAMMTVVDEEGCFDKSSVEGPYPQTLNTSGLGLTEE
jgi:hypothetical protein